MRKKNIKQVKALDNLSFDIYDGELICLLGPNGAGKTTLIKILTLLLLSTKGQFNVNGIPGDLKNEHKIKASIGAMLMGERGLYWKLTGRENLNYFYSLFHQPKKDMKSYIQYLIDLMNLQSIADRPVETFSSGQKMKFAFLRALIADPPILILDEPTIAMDVQGARELRKIVKNLNKDKKKTILYSTHIMHEVEELADRVLIIDKGQLIDYDTVDNLTQDLQLDESISIEGDFPDIDNIKSSLESLNGIKHVAYIQATSLESKDKLTVICNDSKEDMPKVISSLLENNVTISYLNPKKISIEDVFIAKTGYSLNEDTSVKL